MARTYYEVATGDRYIEATVSVKIMAHENMNTDVEEIVYDYLYSGDFIDLTIVKIDKEEVSNLDIEIEEIG
jgi:hypothetical protein